MRRSLRLFDVLCIGLNAIVGSGIFLLPDDIYRQMGVYSPLAFLLCAVGLLPIALSYAALAGQVEETGGPYVYTSRAFGPRAGFLVGWMCYANALFSFAAVSAAAAAYALRLFPNVAAVVPPEVVGLGAVIAFSALNYRGARPGAWAVDAFTIAKFLVLFVLVAALVPAWQTPAATGLPRGMAGIGAATYMALFAAQGFEVVGVPAGETQNPRRNVPIAVVGSLVLASVLYVVVQGALLGSGIDWSVASDAPLADAALRVLPALGLVVAIGGLVSNLGFISGTALGTPRYLFAMASNGHFPGVLSRVHERFQSPHVAIVFTAGLVGVFVVALDYRALIGISNVSVAVQFLATCLALVRLQKESKGRAYAMWGGSLCPWLGVVVSLWIFTEASRVEFLWAAGTLVVGFVTRAWLGRARQPS